MTTGMGKPRCQYPGCRKLAIEKWKGYCTFAHQDMALNEPQGFSKRVVVEEDQKTPRRPDEITQLRIAEIRKYCTDFDCEHHPVGKRTVMYSLINDEWWGFKSVDDFQGFYQKIKEAHDRDPNHPDYLSDEYFSDRGRASYGNRGDSSLAHVLLDAAKYLDLDYWKEHPVVPMIICEKDGHGPVLNDEVCRPSHVTLHTSNGTLSRPWVKEIADSISKIVNHQYAPGKFQTVAIGYVGDFDAAGCIRIENTLRRGSVRTKGIPQILLRDHNLRMDECVTWDRIMIDKHQMENLIDPRKYLLAKQSDKCYKNFKDTFYPNTTSGDSIWCAEVEAFDPDFQRELVQNFINKYLLFDGGKLRDKRREETNTEVLRGKALLSLYTRNPETPLTEEYEAVYATELNSKEDGYLDTIYSAEDARSIKHARALNRTIDLFMERESVALQLEVDTDASIYDVSVYEWAKQKHSLEPDSTNEPDSEEDN